MSLNSFPLPRDAAAFGLPPSANPVTVIQTHIGWVYLLDDCAFKIKKPVKFDFLDFTTAEQRKWACEREISLNRRLCEGLYLALLPVIELPDGTRQCVPDPPEPNAKIVDWSVKMRRLPEERMLDKLLERDSVERKQVRTIAKQLVEFYAKQRGAIPPGGLGDLDAVRFNVAENLREGESISRELLAAGALALITRRAEHFLNKHGELIRARVRDGFVADGHGDLRAENICVPENGPPVLFDCIEFNDRFRICDSALDVAFLMMDLDSRGRRDLSATFIKEYMHGCDKNLPQNLLQFYLGYRAFVKGKVAAWIAADRGVAEPQRKKCMEQARSLFDLAVRYAVERTPLLLVLCGVSGSGKSSLATALAQRFGAEHLASDAIRDEIVARNMPPEIRYSAHNSFLAYERLMERGAREIARKRIVVLDATFTSSSTRTKAVAMARAGGARAILIWADCPPENLQLHFEDRRASGILFGSEATEKIALQQLEKFETPKAREGFAAVCRIDTRAEKSAAIEAAWNDVTLAISKLSER